jgi:hypothetical protein
MEIHGLLTMEPENYNILLLLHHRPNNDFLKFVHILEHVLKI